MWSAVRLPLIISPVGASGSGIARTSTPSPRRAERIRSPNSSAPTRPIQQAVRPSRVTPIATFDSAPPNPRSKSRAKRNGPVRRAANRAIVSPKVTRSVELSPVTAENLRGVRSYTKTSGPGRAVEHRDRVLVTVGEELQQPPSLLGHRVQIRDRLP